MKVLDSNLQKLLMVSLLGIAFSVGCSSVTKSNGSMAPAEASADLIQEVNDSETALEEDSEIQAQLPDDTSFEDLEEEFADVNQEQIKKDLAEISNQISETERELENAKSVLSQMIEKNQPANLIETQKNKLVVLEDQLFDLSDEKTLKEIEAEVTKE